LVIEHPSEIILSTPKGLVFEATNVHSKLQTVEEAEDHWIVTCISTTSVPDSREQAIFLTFYNSLNIDSLEL
jgi:hypothetical protein